MSASSSNEFEMINYPDKDKLRGQLNLRDLGEEGFYVEKPPHMSTMALNEMEHRIIREYGLVSSSIQNILSPALLRTFELRQIGALLH